VLVAGHEHGEEAYHNVHAAEVGGSPALQEQETTRFVDFSGGEELQAFVDNGQAGVEDIVPGLPQGGRTFACVMDVVSRATHTRKREKVTV
jgi:hypothetical protein